ncbi:ribonuclease E [Kytococcus aerolatus]|uniref:Ribonuclease E n=1 Tax=Kytococcus aerolatus TaxID=592308 RepID=A0A212U2F4_9MICO|nr:Rne/Rng family ribonuclease [Kytococcus aerolatus]SNC72330.1 ribonuclease E [Kytococcus aerolatus]
MTTDQFQSSGGQFGLLFQAPDPEALAPRSRRRQDDEADDSPQETPARRARHTADEEEPAPRRNRRSRTDREEDPGEGTGRRRRRRGESGRQETAEDEGAEVRGEARGSGDAADEGRDHPATDEGEGSEEGSGRRSRRRRGGRGRTRGQEAPEHALAGESGEGQEAPEERPAGRQADGDDQGDSGGEGSGPSDERSSRRSRKRSRGSRRSRTRGEARSEDRAEERTGAADAESEVTRVQGSTRLAAKKQRRKEGRDAGRRRAVLTEAEFLARRESVERTMVVRESEKHTQIGVLEDGVLVEHYIDQQHETTMVGNVYLGRVQNVLPSMEAAFVDIGKGRNGVLYAGEVNWDAAGLEKNEPKRIESALQSGQTVLVQVTKDPIGHKGARLTSQISLPGRYLVYVPGSSTTGISRKLPDTERTRLKKILKEVVPAEAGVIVRTAAEGASEEELRADVQRLAAQWEQISSAQTKGSAPALVHGEPDLTVRVIRDVFTEDFARLEVSGEKAWRSVTEYVEALAPDLAPKVHRWEDERDIFAAHRIDEQLAKAMDRKVWLPSGGSLIIDRTEAMTVVDVNTGKFVGAGGNLEETVTKNNLEAAEEIVRQLRLRDIGGIIVVDFIDMVLESNRDLVVRRLVECLARDRTKHQVAEVTSLGLVQMTRKRVGSGLVEVFGTTCQHCDGFGLVTHDAPVGRQPSGREGRPGRGADRSRERQPSSAPVLPTAPASGPSVAQIARAVHTAAVQKQSAHEEPQGSPRQAAPRGAQQQETAAPAATSPSSPEVPTEQTTTREAAPAETAAAPAATGRITGRIGRRASVPTEEVADAAGSPTAEPEVAQGVETVGAQAPSSAPRRSSRRRVVSTETVTPTAEAPSVQPVETQVAGGAASAGKAAPRRTTRRRASSAPGGAAQEE